MNAKLNRLLNQSGITALETAIILIAFVVVAAVFAFTVLSTGTFLTERSKEAAYAGLQEVRGSMELKGGIIAHYNGTKVNYVAFTLSTVSGGSSVDLSTATPKVRISYRDASTNVDLTPTAGVVGAAGQWVVNDCTNCQGADGAWILIPGGLARIYAWMPSATVLGVNSTFAIEVKPPTGGTMLIERTLPASLTTMTDLH
jgi:archaeal flagellin FlaB